MGSDASASASALNATVSILPNPLPKNGANRTDDVDKATPSQGRLENLSASTPEEDRAYRLLIRKLRSAVQYYQRQEAPAVLAVQYANTRLQEARDAVDACIAARLAAIAELDAARERTNEARRELGHYESS